MTDKFNILKTQAVIDLLDLFELKRGIDYRVKRARSGFKYCSIPLTDTNNSKGLYEILKDLNIYLPEHNFYLSDFIMLKIKPSKEAIELIDMYDIDQLFSPYLTTDKLFKYIKS